MTAIDILKMPPNRSIFIYKSVPHHQFIQVAKLYLSKLWLNTLHTFSYFGRYRHHPLLGYLLKSTFYL